MIKRLAYYQCNEPEYFYISMYSFCTEKRKFFKFPHSTWTHSPQDIGWQYEPWFSAVISFPACMPIQLQRKSQRSFTTGALKSPHPPAPFYPSSKIEFCIQSRESRNIFTLQTKIALGFFSTAVATTAIAHVENIRRQRRNKFSDVDSNEMKTNWWKLLSPWNVRCRLAIEYCLFKPISPTKGVYTIKRHYLDEAR